MKKARLHLETAFGYFSCVIIIRFKDAESERRAIGYLVGRFPCKSYADGDTLVPKAALAHLADEGITFTVIGSATYEQLAPLRNTTAVAV